MYSWRWRKKRIIIPMHRETKAKREAEEEVVWLFGQRNEQKVKKHRAKEVCARGGAVGGFKRIQKTKRAEPLLAKSNELRELTIFLLLCFRMHFRTPPYPSI